LSFRPSASPTTRTATSAPSPRDPAAARAQIVKRAAAGKALRTLL
jgi:hypothetical protein